MIGAVSGMKLDRSVERYVAGSVLALRTLQNRSLRSLEKQAGFTANALDDWNDICRQRSKESLGSVVGLGIPCHSIPLRKLWHVACYELSNVSLYSERSLLTAATHSCQLPHDQRGDDPFCRLRQIMRSRDNLSIVKITNYFAEYWKCSSRTIFVGYTC